MNGVRTTALVWSMQKPSTRKRSPIRRQNTRTGMVDAKAKHAQEIADKETEYPHRYGRCKSQARARDRR